MFAVAAADQLLVRADALELAAAAALCVPAAAGAAAEDDGPTALDDGKKGSTADLEAPSPLEGEAVNGKAGSAEGTASGAGDEKPGTAAAGGAAGGGSAGAAASPSLAHRIKGNPYAMNSVILLALGSGLAVWLLAIQATVVALKGLPALLRSREARVKGRRGWWHSEGGVCSGGGSGSQSFRGVVLHHSCCASDGPPAAACVGGVSVRAWGLR